MKKITYITGNQNKADFLESYLEHPIEHRKIELHEIQSLDLLEVVKHKVRQAYQHVGGPVVVEDTGLEFVALGKLPGPFIRFFVEELGYENICQLLEGKDRSAIGRCIYGYFDGENEAYFEGVLEGSVAEKPAGENGFGFDKIFISKGYDVTRASLDDEEYKKTYMTLKPIAQLKIFLCTLK
ncbi:non-canonical purine NTP pyrophosphatase [Candidatus Nomurabacteria bacterium CG10_big_fil_rev_8_21_14_0_10_35_16]|uniref:Non-canonical purine NTP pyrophosphatase n=1 Tax=Candidatus Nomurabacteria bacterium CG10_big_fil_rev_8_21_14_0_10_35_16 TaxID=1974731 RepID=A0A2H0TB28_9BACT|nr:MAG: non-canonical purine NTP pyrophosphatase [Candidatus Nomurabacteria bacterium CG10_big_fil_rev_8_21_14_0_10_35_16]